MPVKQFTHFIVLLGFAEKRPQTAQCEEQNRGGSGQIESWSVEKGHVYIAIIQCPTENLVHSDMVP